jgi:hypothetical protein
MSSFLNRCSNELLFNISSWNDLIKFGEAQTDFQLIGREEAQV